MSGAAATRPVQRIRGVLGTVFTGTLVIVAGFAVGVVVGLVLEDPALVTDYAGGGTRSVSLEEAAEGDAVAEGLRAPPLQRLGFSIQVGAFTDVAAARRLAEELETGGFPVYVASPGDVDGEDASAERWRVRVGPLSTRERADRVAEELRSTRSLPTWVLDESAS